MGQMYLTRFGTMGTTSTGIEEKEHGGSVMSWPTRFEDLGHEAHY
jgi:hypothetical protein